MADVIDLDGFEECKTCGAMILANEECPICEEDERKKQPRKPMTLKKIDPKKEKKFKRRNHEYRY